MGTRAMKGGSAGCPEPHDRAEGDSYQRLIAQEKGLLQRAEETGANSFTAERMKKVEQLSLSLLPYHALFYRNLSPQKPTSHA